MDELTNEELIASVSDYIFLDSKRYCHDNESDDE